MKLFSQDGIEMMDIKSITKEGDRLLLKGKMMGAMNAKIYVGPEDMWGALKLFPLAVIFQMPLLLFKGYLAERKKGKPVKTS